MSARDELAETIARVREYPPAKLADVVLAAGYSKPRTITTAEELDALEFETVIRDAEGHVLERWGDDFANLWATVMARAFIPRGDITLPATVLYEPSA